MSGINKDFKTERIELGLTQQDAAILIDVSRITYIKYEQDPNEMPIGRYEKLLNEFKRLRELKEQE
jgi:DNA-binding XRE family transcriptional regulator